MELKLAEAIKSEEEEMEEEEKVNKKKYVAAKYRRDSQLSSYSENSSLNDDCDKIFYIFIVSSF